MNNAEILDTLPYEAHRCGVSFGSGIGSLEDVCIANELVLKGKSRRISPHLVPRILVNMAAGHIGIKFEMGDYFTKTFHFILFFFE